MKPRKGAMPKRPPATAGPAAARSSEARFRELFNSAPVAVFVCDREGVIQDYNERAATFWGRRPERGDPAERYCGSLRIFLPGGAELPRDRSPIVEVLRTAQPAYNVEISIERPDGSRLPVMANFCALKDERGEVSGAIASFDDISHLKRAEDELRRADRRKDEFLATLAHELRNPLAPIRNAVQMIQLQGLDAPDAQWALDVIDRQSRQMARLMDDLLDVARITRNRLEMRMQRVELVEVVRTAVETSRPLIEDLRHRLTVNVPPGEIFLDADLARLAQALSNLLNNAAKYTPPGGRIELVVERRDGAVLLKVRDSGIGISATALSGIFEMFAQADRSLERSPGGLGIGLSLARRLISMHGGTLTAHSDGPGKGSEFTVRLPVAPELRNADCGLRNEKKPAATPKSEAPGASAGGFDSSSGPAETRNPKSRRILLVDDNRLAAMSLSMLLRAGQHEVRLAHDGEEALNAAAEFRPEIVVLDIGLPKLNGYDAARRIRQEPWGRKMVLIALTGWGQDEDKQRAREAGFDHHLVKPVDAATLTQLLDSLDQVRTATV